MLIVGTGAVASFLLPRLAACGPMDLQVFGSPSPRLSALQPWTSMGPERVTSDPSLVSPHRDWLIVCKTWQNREKVALLRGAPSPERILLLQNGYDPETVWSELAQVGGVERALSTYGVRSVGPGLSVGGEQGEMVVREGSVWAITLRRAGLMVREESCMQRAVWWKLVVNASLNVVATLGDLPNGAVLERPASRSLAAKAAEEVAGLGRRLGLDLGPTDPVWMMERVARATSENICSTLADVRDGRPTEYDSVNGALLRVAAGHGWSLPVLEGLDRDFRTLLRSSRQQVAS